MGRREGEREEERGGKERRREGEEERRTMYGREREKWSGSIYAYNTFTCTHCSYTAPSTQLNTLRVLLYLHLHVCMYMSTNLSLDCISCLLVQ